jgi:hypothetical protein
MIIFPLLISLLITSSKQLQSGQNLNLQVFILIKLKWKMYKLNICITDSLTQNVETGKDELNNAKTKHGDLNKQLESLQVYNPFTLI